jgi:hypothetical protein
MTTLATDNWRARSRFVRRSPGRLIRLAGSAARRSAPPSTSLSVRHRAATSWCSRHGTTWINTPAGFWEGGAEPVAGCARVVLGADGLRSGTAVTKGAQHEPARTHKNTRAPPRSRTKLPRDGCGRNDADAGGASHVPSQRRGATALGNSARDPTGGTATARRQDAAEADGARLNCLAYGAEPSTSARRRSPTTGTTCSRCAHPGLSRPRSMAEGLAGREALRAARRSRLRSPRARLGEGDRGRRGGSAHLASASTGMKFVSPDQRGTTWRCTWSAIPAPAM